ncbi:hypothetical protein CAPTEDRAFT_222887 [Capitella teleta]|uniref:Tyrosinase copper-binding domain-containing protein n=1 Tax=Capitella teleta TaxID=283909 RepID=R7UA24_CAPTE|nr:hypothetical protein CAPTEDRAFT_222887 [Capitella teleta]|eukprot:ELU02941.1 hypothetical protein CAPTEDRAFT_222887 [Capitella teleta]
MLMRMRIAEFLRIFLLVNIGLFTLGGLRIAFIRLNGLDRHRRSELTDFLAADTANNDQNVYRNIPVTEPRRDNVTDDLVVPNLVHYIWFNTETRPLQFHHMLSILSAHRVLAPDVIYFHTNFEPKGKYWEMVKKIPSLKIVHREPPTSLFGVRIKDPLFYTSHSNVDRIKILMEYGGIYLDFDTLVLSPFEELRKHPCTIAQEVETKACGCIIVCSKHSFFLTLWINSYIDDYRVDEWAYNTGQVPFNLAQRYPQLVNVNKGRMVYPSYKELNKIWGSDSWDWWNNYSVHLYYRLWKDTSPYFKGVEPDEHNVKGLNNTFGQMARMILYGTRDLMDQEEYLK